MTKEEKELLLIDICTRLPYHVKCDINGELGEITKVDIERQEVYIKKGDHHSGTYSIARGDVIKQYLRPMESMTDEEKKEYADMNCLDNADEMENMSKQFYKVGLQYVQLPRIHAQDYLNSIHIDYRGLIEKGLALEASEDMYKIKFE